MTEERKRKGRATRDDGISSLYGGQQKSGKFPFFFSFWVMLIIRQLDLPTKYRRGVATVKSRLLQNSNHGSGTGSGARSSSGENEEEKNEDS